MEKIQDIIIHSDFLITKMEKKKSKDLKPEYGHTPPSELELDFLTQEKFNALYIGTGNDSALPKRQKPLRYQKSTMRWSLLLLK